MRTRVNNVLSFMALLLLASHAAGQDLPIASPREVGLSGERLEQIEPIVEQYIDNGRLPGAVTIIARRGKVVQFGTFGMMDREENKPMRKDTIFRIFSMTKPVTSVAVLKLYEAGLLRLDGAVSEYIPETKVMKVGAVLPEREMTVRDLLRHTAGLPDNGTVERAYREAGLSSLAAYTLEEMMERLDHVSLIYQPGTKWYYSFAADVLARLVEVASGRPYDQYLAEEIFDPLGMQDTAFHVPPDKMGRFAVMYGEDLVAMDAEQPGTSGPFTYEASPRFLSGGGGLVSTATDYMRFCLMLVGKGEFEGHRLLKEETIDMMTRNQLPEELIPISFSPDGRGFGLGFAVRVEETEFGSSSIGEYGWFGGGGTDFWISPREELVVITLTQHTPMRDLAGTLKPIIYEAVLSSDN